MAPAILTLLNAPLAPTDARARNCELIIRKLGEQLGGALVTMSPELATCLQLDSHDLATAQGLEVNKKLKYGCATHRIVATF